MPQPFRAIPAEPLQAADLIPDVVERADAPASSGSPYRLLPNQSFGGTVGHGGDHDRVAIRLEAGRSYEFALAGNGGDALRDTVLALYDAAGRLLEFNDDYLGNYDTSYFTFTPSTSGTYWLDAGGYGTATGDYALGFSRYGAPKTSPTPNASWTNERIATYLTDGFWEDNDAARRYFDVQPGGTLTVNVTALRPEARELALMALDSWSQVTGIRFQAVSSGAANIMFDEVNDNDRAYSKVLTGWGDVMTQSLVRIPEIWFEQPGEGFASYEYQTYLHEIGHALGLGHAGLYNGNGTYATDRLYANDSWQASVMSYFSQADNTAVHASYAFAVTPMIADIIAIQDLYGTPRNVNGGNSVWGEGATISGAFGMANGLMVSRAAVTMTVFDQGGTDWLKLGSDGAAQIINLTGGRVSSVYGLVGNLSIAEGTVIENVVAGRGNDVIRGNAAGNWIAGRNGADTIEGFNGNDTLEGGAGADRLVGGGGDDLYVADALDTLVELANGGIDRIRAAVNFRLAEHFESLLLIQSFAKWGTGNDVANTVVGNSQVNYLSGGEGNDTLFGMAGNDTLAGNIGADRLVGGAGDDVYIRDAGDTVVETANAGFDTVVTSQDIILGDHIEKVVVRGDNAVQVIGNAEANILVGNDARNVLVGGGGEDVIFGGGGGDVFVFAAGQGGRVADFQDDIDLIRIDVGAARWLTAAALVADATERDGGVDLRLAGGLLRIDGVTIDALQDDLLVA